MDNFSFNSEEIFNSHRLNLVDKALRLATETFSTTKFKESLRLDGLHEIRSRLKNCNRY